MMRFVLSLAVACLALGLAATPQASAQYPVYAPQYLGHTVQEHAHHSHYYVPSTSAYYAGYAAPVYQYAPTVSYLPVYGPGATYPQPVAPPSSINYYSNRTYYGGHSGHTHHRWHPGHYLMGHH